MRRAIAGLVIATCVAPSSAPACDPAACDPVVAVVEATVTICARVCEERPDPIHPPAGARGLWSVTAGPAVVGSLDLTSDGCISSLGTCTLALAGEIGPGIDGAGAWCERWSSSGIGTLALPGPRTIAFTYSWDGQAGVLVGSSEHERIAVKASSRGISRGGNCRTEPLTSLRLEAALVLV